MSDTFQIPPQIAAMLANSIANNASFISPHFKNAGKNQAAFNVVVRMVKDETQHSGYGLEIAFPEMKAEGGEPLKFAFNDRAWCEQIKEKSNVIPMHEQPVPDIADMGDDKVEAARLIL